MDEKLGTQHDHLEHVPTSHTQPSTPPDTKLEIQETLQHVDLENRHAFKGDDSDGKVEWNLRKLLAAAFLAMLYTGIISSTQNMLKCKI